MKEDFFYMFVVDIWYELIVKFQCEILCIKFFRDGCFIGVVRLWQVNEFYVFIFLYLNFMLNK